jgi:hypothetical protein
MLHNSKYEVTQNTILDGVVVDFDLSNQVSINIIEAFFHLSYPHVPHPMSKEIFGHACLV